MGKAIMLEAAPSLTSVQGHDAYLRKASTSKNTVNGFYFISTVKANTNLLLKQHIQNLGKYVVLKNNYMD
jgi:hypothetical protein